MFNSFSNASDGFDFGESLPQQISKYILQKILRGEIKAGEKIIEEDISKELNTSRAPVREALYLLQVDGIVERIPRKGTLVKSFSDYEIMEYNDVMIGIIQMAVEYTKGKWQEEHKKRLQDFLESATAECEQGNVIEYQIKVEQQLRFILSVALNKALARFFEEANHILKVFARIRWNTTTMETFHTHIKVFTQSILAEDYDKANKAIYEALKRGVI